MRFVTVREKAIVVAILLAVDLVLTLVLNAMGSEIGSIVLSVLQLAGWYAATRVFRGAGEPVAPRRPWWRMTARPALSGVLGLAYGLVALVNLVLSFAGFGSASGFVSILVEAVLAVLFLNSAKRLRSAGHLRSVGRAGAARGQRPAARPAAASEPVRR
ncbi:hypothetical protein [Leifsonia poae]|uniref:Uncharacterized protein n=1 Tax=Leifsonia poae TaxID=110933 RepID=A0A9W6H9I9_9MICO|nr:hypothetical protein [Leifsonia poae]GLJ75978.1 hypothetical protein GCM10017584_15520 [Leifsonia poae]